MNFKILIVADEFAVALDLQMRLQKLDFDVVGIAVSVDEALILLEQKTVDLVLLDIYLEGEKKGFELAGILHSTYHLPFIFLTAYSDSETLQNSLKIKPMTFLSKPFKVVDLQQNIELAIRNFYFKALNSQPEYFFVKTKKSLNKLKLDDILWLEAFDNYTIIHTSVKKYTVNYFLKDLLAKLGNKFVRIHRSHAVSLSKITAVDTSYVFISAIKLVIGNSYRKDFLAQLNIL